MPRLAVLFCLAMILSSLPAWSEDNAYKVSDIIISAEDKDPESAKKVAIETGQVEAFKKILEQNSIAYDIETPANAILSGVKNFSLKNEKITSTSYSAIMEVVFDNGFIESRLNNNANTNTINEQKQLAAEFTPSPAALIVPLFFHDNNFYLWGEKNSFAAVWENPELNSEIVPFAIPVGDAEDTNLLTLPDALNRNPEKLHALAEKYGATRVIITEATAEPNGEISLTIIEVTKKGEPFVQKSIYKPTGLEDSYTKLLHSAKQVVLRLEEDWKNSLLTETTLPTDANLINAVVEVNSPNEWVEIRDKLNNAKFIKKFSIEEFDSNNIAIVFEFSGDIDNLPQLFSEIGLTFSKDNDRWLLTKF